MSLGHRKAAVSRRCGALRTDSRPGDSWTSRRAVVEWFDLSNGEAVIDVGCGTDLLMVCPTHSVG